MIVYILKCADGSFYTGVTGNISQRILQHFSSIDNHYLKTRKPFNLVFFQEYSDPLDAIEREKQIKKWSKKKKAALIESDWNSLHSYSECTNLTHSKFHIKQSKI